MYPCFLYHIDSMTKTDRIGHYTLHRRIGKGGMAEVYLASCEDASGKITIAAVKAIRSELVSDEAFIRMFLDEARISSILNHPHITKVFACDKENNSPYMACGL